jgi:hypothetical protein
MLPDYESQEAQRDGIKGARNSDDHAAHFVVADKIPPIESRVNITLSKSGQSYGDRRNKEDYGRHVIEEVQCSPPRRIQSSN